jgi:hypothetical protein
MYRFPLLIKYQVEDGLRDEIWILVLYSSSVTC